MFLGRHGKQLGKNDWCLKWVALQNPVVAFGLCLLLYHSVLFVWFHNLSYFLFGGADLRV